MEYAKIINVTRGMISQHKPDKLSARQFQLKIEKFQRITYRFPGEGNGNPLQYSWEIPWTEEFGRPRSMGLQKSQI